MRSLPVLLIGVIALGSACEPGSTITGDGAALDALDARATQSDGSTDHADILGVDVFPDVSITDASEAATTDVPSADVPVDHGVVSPQVCAPAGAMDCSPGTGTGNADQCMAGSSCYLARVQSAVRAVIAEHPEWFDFTNPAGCPNILNVDGYMNGVVDHLVAAGLCAIRDPNAPGEEVTVKYDNGFAENFDIVASAGCARYGGLIYTGYCAPAWW